MRRCGRGFFLISTRKKSSCSSLNLDTLFSGQRGHFSNWIAALKAASVASSIKF